MISRMKWSKLDWFLAIVVFIIILFVVAYNSGLAIYVRGALHLLAGALLWAGNALNAIGR
jgi:hypothetical protein